MSQQAKIVEMYKSICLQLGVTPPAVKIVDQIFVDGVLAEDTSGVYLTETKEIQILSCLDDETALWWVAPHELAHYIQLRLSTLGGGVIPCMRRPEVDGEYAYFSPLISKFFVGHDRSFACALGLVYNVMDELGYKHYPWHGIRDHLFCEFEYEWDEAGYKQKLESDMMADFNLIRRCNCTTIEDTIATWKKRPGEVWLASIPKIPTGILWLIGGVLLMKLLQLNV